jgi:adenylate kinase family enzyme
MADRQALCEAGTRISVVGTCGSGKTTTASALAQRLGLAHIELDALSWEPNWTSVPDEEFRVAVARAAASDRWVIDGNYSKVRDLVWARADTVVWLDYSFPRVFAQLLRRTFRRALRRETLWHGNRERLATAFFSRDSILLWAIKTHGRRKREYGELLGRSENRRLCVVQLRSPREARQWLARVRPQALCCYSTPLTPTALCR